MTRKDELAARARDYVSLFVMSGAEPAATKNLTWMLQHVEREALSRCQYKIESLMEKENESTDDQVWEYRDWLKDQQQELGR